jgi:hypothetical protein
MKTIKESIIGRKGVSNLGGLKSGQIVMINYEYYMYMTYDDANSIPKISKYMSESSRVCGYDFTLGGFFYQSEIHNVEAMSAGKYTHGLKCRSSHEWDVQHVSEQVFEIGLYKQYQLAEMSRKTRFREIK